MEVEQLTGPVAYHGEGPVWSPRWGGLRWVDMLAGDVLPLAADGSVERRHVGDVAAALRPRRGGGAVIGIERGFALEDAGRTLEHAAELWSDDAIRMNEGGCDPDGRFYCGSMAYDQRRARRRCTGSTPTARSRVVLEGLTISNGLEWSPDGTLAYYNDTRRARSPSSTTTARRADRPAALRAPVEAAPGRADGRRRGRRLGGAVRRRRGAPYRADGTLGAGARPEGR